MKKFIPFLLLCVALNATAQEIDDPIIITPPDTTVQGAAYSFTEEGITVSATKGAIYPADHEYNHDGVAYFSCHANNSLTISATQAFKGIAINGLTNKDFTATSSKGSLIYLSDDEETTTGEPVLVITDVDATSVTISCDKQLRCYSLEVYFSENPDGPEEQGDVVDTVRFTATIAEALDYSEDSTFSEEGAYSYWLKLAPATGYPQVWLDMYAAVKGDLSGEYSLYNFNVGDYSYVQLSVSELDYEYAYDQEFTIAKTANGYHVEGWIIGQNDVMYMFVYDGAITLVAPGTEEGIEETNAGVKATKIVRNGQLVIVRGEKSYNLLGAEL